MTTVRHFAIAAAIAVGVLGIGAQAQTAYSAAGSQPCVGLRWDDYPSAVSFNVYRTQSGTSFTKINSAPVTTPKYVDCTVAAEQTYRYVVTAVVASGAESSYSSQTSLPLPFYEAEAVVMTATATRTEGLTGSNFIASRARYRNPRSELLPLDASLTVFFSGGSNHLSVSADQDLTGLDDAQTLAAYTSARGESAQFADSAMASTVGLGAPLWLRVTQHDWSSVLGWRISASARATAQRLYRSLNSGQGYQLLANLDSSTETFVDSTVAPGQTYFYVVTAVAGLAESGFSNEVMTVAQSAIAAPRWLVVTASPIGATLIWRHSETTGISSQIVYRSSTTGGPYEFLQQLDSSVQTTRDLTALPGHTYFYVLAAFRGSTASSYSNEVKTVIP